MIKYAKSTGGFYRRDVPATVPEDAVEISEELYMSLLNGQAAGKVIKAGSDGVPFLMEPAAPTANELVYAQITSLERTITQRRLREAALGKDGGWLAEVDAQIEALRATLT